MKYYALILLIITSSTMAMDFWPLKITHVMETLNSYEIEYEELDSCEESLCTKRPSEVCASLAFSTNTDISDIVLKASGIDDVVSIAYEKYDGECIVKGVSDDV